MRRVAAVTFGRSDYSSLIPLLRRARDGGMEMPLVVSGTHLSQAFGNTADLIEGDGFEIAERVPIGLEAGDRETVARALGRAIPEFAGALSRVAPEAMLVVGDRVELLAAGAAGVVLGLPIAHVSGGDVSEGALDEQVRHAVTKLSHLHFVAMEQHAERVRRLGEEPWRVVVTGDPALDLLRDMRGPAPPLEELVGVALDAPLIVVGYHPATRGARAADEEVDDVLAAVDAVGGTVVMTYPGAEAGSDAVLERMQAFAASHDRAALVPSLGQDAYYALLARADVLVGNSSSAIWEAPTLLLPAVNVGDRQRGRVRAANVIDVDGDATAIEDALRRALSPQFRRELDGLVNPYGDGRAAERILAALETAPPTDVLLRKRFVDG